MNRFLDSRQFRSTKCRLNRLTNSKTKCDTAKIFMFVGWHEDMLNKMFPNCVWGGGWTYVFFVKEKWKSRKFKVSFSHGVGSFTNQFIYDTWSSTQGRLHCCVFQTILFPQFLYAFRNFKNVWIKGEIVNLKNHIFSTHTD